MAAKFQECVPQFQLIGESLKPLDPYVAAQLGILSLRKQLQHTFCLHAFYFFSNVNYFRGTQNALQQMLTRTDTVLAVAIRKVLVQNIPRDPVLSGGIHDCVHQTT